MDQADQTALADPAVLSTQASLAVHATAQVTYAGSESDCLKILAIFLTRSRTLHKVRLS